MTQNNELELIERLALVVIDLRRSHNGFDFIASLSELEEFAKAYKVAIDANDKSPISQNEQQEAFEKWFGETYNDLQFNKAGMIDAWQAATQASESEINSLKQRVEELTASNNQLREALYVSKQYITEAIIDDKYHEASCSLDELYLLRDKAINLYNSALSSTPSQSLAEHDNEVLSKVISLLEDMNANGKHWLPDYIEAIRALKVTP